MYYISDVSRQAEGLYGVTDSADGVTEYYTLSAINDISGTDIELWGYNKANKTCYPLVCYKDKGTVYLAYRGHLLSKTKGTVDEYKQKGYTYCKQVAFCMYTRLHSEAIRKKTITTGNTTYTFNEHVHANGTFFIAEDKKDKQKKHTLTHRFIHISEDYFKPNATISNNLVVNMMQDEYSETVEEWVFIEDDGVRLYKREDIHDFREAYRGVQLTKQERVAMTRYQLLTGQTLVATKEGVVAGFKEDTLGCITVPKGLKRVQLNGYPKKCLVIPETVEYLHLSYYKGIDVENVLHVVCLSEAPQVNAMLFYQKLNNVNRFPNLKRIRNDKYYIEEIAVNSMKYFSLDEKTNKVSFVEGVFAYRSRQNYTRYDIVALLDFLLAYAEIYENLSDTDYEGIRQRMQYRIDNLKQEIAEYLKTKPSYVASDFVSSISMMQSSPKCKNEVYLDSIKLGISLSFLCYGLANQDFVARLPRFCSFVTSIITYVMQA